jgi:hypothetical protein
VSVETIFKYRLANQEEQFVEMPASAQILCVQMQGGLPCLWAQQPRDAALASRRILIIDTGWDLPESATRYIGTVQNGPLVWHIYEGGPA